MKDTTKDPTWEHLFDLNICGATLYNPLFLLPMSTKVTETLQIRAKEKLSDVRGCRDIIPFSYVFEEQILALYPGIRFLDMLEKPGMKLYLNVWKVFHNEVTKE